MFKLLMKGVHTKKLWEMTDPKGNVTLQAEIASQILFQDSHLCEFYKISDVSLWISYTMVI